MDIIKLSKKEIKLDKEDLKILDVLHNDLKTNEQFVTHEKDIIREIESLAKQASYYIKTEEDFSEKIRKGKPVAPELLKQLYKIIRDTDQQLGNLIEQYAKAIYKVKVKQDQIMKELIHLQKNLRLNSKDIYQVLSNEPTSHYIQ